MVNIQLIIRVNCSLPKLVWFASFLEIIRRAGTQETLHDTTPVSAEAFPRERVMLCTQDFTHVLWSKIPISDLFSEEIRELLHVENFCRSVVQMEHL